jgi:hypothetical protein
MMNEWILVKILTFTITTKDNVATYIFNNIKCEGTVEVLQNSLKGYT